MDLKNDILIIPSTSGNKNYTDNILKNIREIYPNEHEVEIILEENDNVNLGIIIIML
jgi:hypothetical protein